MPVIRVILLILIAGGGFSFSLLASAAPNCWNGGGTTFSFGTVTAGQSASTSGQVAFTCNNYETVPQYFRACLTLQDNAPLAMNPNGVSGYPLYFNVYSSTDTSDALSANSTVYAEEDFVVPVGEAVEKDFTLISKIISGQTKLTASDYYKYGIWTEIGRASCRERV